MIPRYQEQRMREIWGESNKFKNWYRVEVAYLAAYFKHSACDDGGLIERLRSRLDNIDWSAFAAKVNAYDSHLSHDVVAFLYALKDELGCDARLIHLGITSSDVVDTAFALSLGASGQEVQQKLKAIIDALWQQANVYKGVLCLGRTHGQAAEPTSLGVKLLSHCNEMIRSYRRLNDAISGVMVGKFSGAVGVYAHTHPQIEEMALEELGLTAETVSTQVVARDRHAALFAALAVLGGSVERFAVEIRLLMHGQIAEVFEPFHSEQKGSSAMPHKKNPVLCENLSGLMRLIRSYSISAMENQALWHERDISHSSVERVIAEDAFSVMDFALKRLGRVISGLVIDRDRIKENLLATGEVLMSQAIMLALIDKGMMRHVAHELVQKAAHRAKPAGFLAALKQQGIGQYLSDEEIKYLLVVKDQIAHEDILFARTAEAMRGMQCLIR